MWIFFCKEMVPKHKCEKTRKKYKRTLSVGPSFSGDTPLMKKNLKNKILRKNFFLTESTQQYNDQFKREEEIRERSDYEDSIIVSDDMLDYNQKQFNPFSTRRCYKDLDSNCLSPSYFNLQTEK